MFKGTIKKLIRDRGFGFISAEDGRDVFFHRTEVVGVDFDSLHEGDTVTFEVEKGEKGPKATKVNVSST
jgi:CspA family cold shock protein